MPFSLNMDRIKALALLKDRFGHGAFRGAQEAAINGLLSRKDVFYVAATGTGKRYFHAEVAVQDCP